MSTGYQSGLVSAIPFHIIHNVAWDLGAPFWDGCSNSKTLGCVIFKELIDFQHLGVLPFCVASSFVNECSLVMIPWNLESILVSGAIAKVLETSLVYHSSNNFLSLGISLAPFPTRHFEQVILSRVQSQRNRIVAKDVIEVSPIG